MRMYVLTACVMVAAAVTMVSATSRNTTANADQPQIGHMVFFTLKDRTDANRAKLIAACNTHLTQHEGTVYYSAGAMAPEFDRDVNDREWDVALHLVFASRAAHDKYQDHPRHLKFIEENKELWAKVRVFDSTITPVAAGK